MTDGFFTQAGFLQYAIAFGDPAANLARVKQLFSTLSCTRNALIVLPELWAYGFDYVHARKLAAETPALLLELQALAEELGIVIAGSLLEKHEEDNREDLYNTLFYVGREGVLGAYRKQNLFSFWEEDRYFKPGGIFYPVASPLGLLGGIVCYDLRFPEIARQQAFQGAQVMVVSAEWPKARIDHWLALVRARAIENQVFVVACNSCGTTGEHVLGGRSMVAGPDGTILMEADDGEAALAVALDFSGLKAVRTKFCPPGKRSRPLQDREKLMALPGLLNRLGAIRRQQGKIAFTNGCFDILHSGHVAYLEEARSTADCLVVGLNSDSSVRAIKGPARPVNRQTDRARILSALACVDYVVIFDEETPLGLIKAVRPDVLVKGADWAEDDIVGAAEVKTAGGRVVRIPFEHDVSTSSLISRIQSRD